MVKKLSDSPEEMFGRVVPLVLHSDGDGEGVEWPLDINDLDDWKTRGHKVAVMERMIDAVQLICRTSEQAQRRGDIRMPGRHVRNVNATA